MQLHEHPTHLPGPWSQLQPRQLGRRLIPQGEAGPALERMWLLCPRDWAPCLPSTAATELGRVPSPFAVVEAPTSALQRGQAAQLSFFFGSDWPFLRSKGGWPGLKMQPAGELQWGAWATDSPPWGPLSRGPRAQPSSHAAWREGCIYRHGTSMARVPGQGRVTPGPERGCAPGWGR